MKKISVTCISDLHGYQPKLPGGDLLIVAGDHTARNSENEVALFDYWLNEQPYRKKIVIGGNHDNVLEDERIKLQFCDYLLDSGTEFEGFKIWGSPWTLNFQGQNEECMAFGLDTEKQLSEKWDLIPKDTDILITHSPPHKILDGTIRKRVGSLSLRDQIRNLPSLKLHVFGHVHEGYGKTYDGYRLDFEGLVGVPPLFVNASHVTLYYENINEPIIVEL